MKTDSRLSRRRLLASMPAVAVTGIPATATALSSLPESDAEIVRLVDKWFAAYKEAQRLREAFDVYPPRHDHAADQAVGDAWSRAAALVTEILDTPAQSLAGLAAKARMVVADDDDVCDYARSFARDLLAMNAA
jgi:hypothetical protein